MPNYTYRCKNCSYEFEEFHKMSDNALITCPSCGTDNLVRLIEGGAGLVFKGSGFYLTDYKKTNSSPAGESKTEKDSGTKTDAKSTESKSTETKSAETKSKDSGTTKKE